MEIGVKNRTEWEKSIKEEDAQWSVVPCKKKKKKKRRRRRDKKRKEKENENEEEGEGE